jgi:hypothetical protein
MSLHLPRRRRNVTPVTARQVTSLTGGNPDALTSTIYRPDELSHLDLSAATTAPEPSSARAWVTATIGRLLGTSALDDLTSDVLDAHVRAQHAGWDVSTDREAPDRLHVTLRLAAAHLQGITATQLKVAELRAQYTQASASVAKWTTELTGEPAPVYEMDATPVTVHTTSVLAGEPVVAKTAAYLNGTTPHISTREET